MAKFSDEDIRKAAYFIWKNAGGKNNDSVQNWNMAIRQLEENASIKANLAALTLARNTAKSIKAAPFSAISDVLAKKKSV